MRERQGRGNGTRKGDGEWGRSIGSQLETVKTDRDGRKREGGRELGREGGRKGGKEGRREGGREEGKEGGREGRRDGARSRLNPSTRSGLS